MKKILAVVLLMLSASAFAQYHGPRHHHGGYWHRGGNGWVWVAPALIGGIIGYEISKNQPPQPPIVIQQPQPNPQNCSPWVETQNPDGTITRTRTCAQ